MKYVHEIEAVHYQNGKFSETPKWLLNATGTGVIRVTGGRLFIDNVQAPNECWITRYRDGHLHWWADEIFQSRFSAAKEDVSTTEQTTEELRQLQQPCILISAQRNATEYELVETATVGDGIKVINSKPLTNHQAFWALLSGFPYSLRVNSENGVTRSSAIVSTLAMVNFEETKEPAPAC